MISRIGDKSKTSGFTLLEAVAVIAIIGIFFAVSIPLFSKFAEGAKLDTAARSVASTLKVARSYAVAIGDMGCSVVFDTSVSPNEYFYSYDGVNPAEKKYRLPAGIWFYKPGDSDPVGNAIEFKDDIAHFRPSGELYEPVDRSVSIADGRNADARSKVITVERTTGNLEIE